MAVRNFWIEGDIDGRFTPLRGGPMNKRGGFSLRVMMRNDGGIVSAVRLEGYAFEDGSLRLDVRATDPNNELTITNALAENGMAGVDHVNAFRIEGKR